MSKKILGLILLSIVGLGLTSFAVFQMSNAPSAVPSPTPFPLGIEERVNLFTPDASAVAELRLGGSSYKDPEGVYTLLYPNDFSLDTQSEGGQTSFSKWGPTQRGETELYDGAMITIEKIQLDEERGLTNWVDDNIKVATSGGVSKITTPKKAITLNGYPGYTYTIEGLGIFQSIVLQKDEGSENVVIITTMVADPGNLGFQNEVNNSLSTLELLK